MTNDTQGVKKIYALYLPKIEAIIKRMGGSKDDAWEIFQESLVVILNKAQEPDFQLTSSFYTFLVSISKFKWYNESKKKYKKNVTIESLYTLKGSDDIEETIIKLERFELYKDKMAELGPECRRLFELFFNKVSLREIAVKLELTSENAAKQKKYKCQKKLLEKIKNDARYRQLL